MNSAGPHCAWYVYGTGGGDTHVDPGTATLATATWYYLTLAYDSTNGLKSYVNASSDGTAAAKGALSILNNPSTYIGNSPINAGRFWNGAIDECRIASVARDANWITTEYNNQNAPTTFQTLGAEVSLNPIVGLYTK